MKLEARFRHIGAAAHKHRGRYSMNAVHVGDGFLECTNGCIAVRVPFEAEKKGDDELPVGTMFHPELLKLTGGKDLDFTLRSMGSNVEVQRGPRSAVGVPIEGDFPKVDKVMEPHKGETVTVHISPKYLLAALKAMGADESVTLTIPVEPDGSAVSGPIFLKTPEGATGAVMPRNDA